MSLTRLPESPVADWRTAELTAGDEPLLQRFFDRNPGYFETVGGEPARPDEAHEEIHDMPPAGWPFTKKWVIGYVDPCDELAALANVITDLPAPGVWHLATFMIDASRHGNGQAQMLCQGLENWACANGAMWSRLAVVQGNTRAERFWERLGYRQARLRTDIAMGRRINALRVMVKPLTGGTMAQYVQHVERDRPPVP